MAYTFFYYPCLQIINDNVPNFEIFDDVPNPNMIALSPTSPDSVEIE